MAIVKANHSDIPDIVRLNNQIHVETPLFHGSSPLWVSEQVQKGTYFVVRDEGVVRGAVCLLEKEGQFHLETIAIEKNLQGKGLGRQFVDFAKKKAKESGFKSLLVDTYCEYNVDKFYEACGFRKIPTFAKYRGKPFHRFTVELEE